MHQACQRFYYTCQTWFTFTKKTWCLLFKRQIVSLTSCVSNYSFLFLLRRWILHYRTGRQSHPSGVSQHEPLHGRHHGRDEISQDSLARTRRGRAFERRRPFSGGCHRSGSHGPMGLALQGHADSGEKTTKCNGISAFFVLHCKHCSQEGVYWMRWKSSKCGGNLLRNFCSS